MSTLQRPARSDVSAVALVRWPEEEQLRRFLASAEHPRLLVVERGGEIPLVVDRLEDWVSATADDDEFRLRIEALEIRAAIDPSDDGERPVFDRDDLLRFRGRWVALSPVDERLVRVLLARFEECVRREELVAHTGGADSSLSSAIKRLRARLATIGLQVHTVRGRGYVLSSRPFSTPSQPPSQPDPHRGAP